MQYKAKYKQIHKNHQPRLQDYVDQTVLMVFVRKLEILPKLKLRPDFNNLKNAVQDKIYLHHYTVHTGGLARRSDALLVHGSNPELVGVVRKQILYSEPVHHIPFCNHRQTGGYVCAEHNRKL